MGAGGGAGASTVPLSELDRRPVQQRRRCCFRPSSRSKSPLPLIGQVLNEFKELQDCSATTIAELRGTLKTREFELDRARMVAEECRANTLHLRTEHEIAVKKLEVLRNDFYDTQMQYNTRVAELQVVHCVLCTVGPGRLCRVQW